MHETKPRVEIIAWPRVNWHAIDNFLWEEYKVPPAVPRDKSFYARIKDQEVSDPEALVEFAARSCYRSFAPGLNANVTKIRENSKEYFGNILESKHGCYDSETEVLTSRGWKYWPDVNLDDELATRTSFGIIEYHKPKSIYSSFYSGRMFRVKSPGVDLLITPNHKLLVCPTTTKLGRKRDDSSYDFFKAEEVGTISHAYIKTGTWVAKTEENWLSRDEAALLGFAIGDGTFYRSGQYCSFHLRKERKVNYLRKLANSVGATLLQPNDDKFSIYRGDCRDAFWLLLSTALSDNSPHRRIPDPILTSESRESLDGLLEGLLESDGCYTETSTAYDTTSAQLAGQVQQMALHCGKAATIQVNSNRDSSYGTLPIYRVTLLNRNLKPEVNKYAGMLGRSYWVDKWEGNIYCAEVPNHTLYVRRNGKSVWCGNSVLEHSQLTFLFHNVSRVFTHELVRHRAGVAISQESLRYVRLTDLGFRIPPILEPQRERIISVVETLEEFQKDMAEKFGLDEEGVPFHYKKEVTSALRRLAPLGLSTTIVWSANFRTLRWLIETRTSLGAEEEIRNVFDVVAGICLFKFPLVFQDFSRTNEGEWIPKHSKV